MGARAYLGLTSHLPGLALHLSRPRHQSFHKIKIAFSFGSGRPSLDPTFCRSLVCFHHCGFVKKLYSSAVTACCFRDTQSRQAPLHRIDRPKNKVCGANERHHSLPHFGSKCQPKNITTCPRSLLPSPLADTHTVLVAVDFFGACSRRGLRILNCVTISKNSVPRSHSPLILLPSSHNIAVSNMLLVSANHTPKRRLSILCGRTQPFAGVGCF